MNNIHKFSFVLSFGSEEVPNGLLLSHCSLFKLCSWIMFCSFVTASTIDTSFASSANNTSSPTCPRATFVETAVGSAASSSTWSPLALAIRPLPSCHWKCRRCWWPRPCQRSLPMRQNTTPSNWSYAAPSGGSM